jgi:hypothetical protein
METFETFESLFSHAISWGDIEYSDNPGIKAINKTYFEWEFSIWLQKNEMWKLESEDITRFLTKKNWERFMGEIALWERRWKMKNDFKPPKKPKYDHSAEIVGVFCNLIHYSKIDEKQDGETNAKFCKRICDRFGIEYRDKVRQFFSVDAQSIKLNVPTILRECLLYLDSNENELFIKYLEKNQLIVERMYG